MAKYDYNFKLKVVMSYMNGEGGYYSLAKKYDIPNKYQVRKWVNAYKAFGKDGLKTKDKHTNYTIQFKLDVLNYMIRREQQLEHENQLLKAELAFLKKLRAFGMDIPERIKDNAKQK